jgi:hypothetical protein
MKALGSSSSQHYQPVADGFLEFMPIHLISSLWDSSPISSLARSAKATGLFHHLFCTTRDR